MNYSGWLIYNYENAEYNRSYIGWMIEEARELGMELVLKLRENFTIGIRNNSLMLEYDGTSVNPPDFVIMRSMDSEFSLQLERMGCPVFNSSFISGTCNNKAATHQYLAQFNIPMMDTYFCRSTELNLDNLSLEYPIVVKDVNGRGGAQVFKAETREELEKVLSGLYPKKVVIQKMGEVPGKDVRVFVVGKEIVGAILRSSNVDFRANHSLGGHSEVYNLTESQAALVNKIINKFDIGMVGIDFIFDKQGNFILNEIEDVVGSRTLSKNTDINIVRIYLKHILKTLDKQ